MQLKRNHKRNIVLGIAALFILYGLLDWIFKFNISPSTVNNVTYVLMIGAFILLFSKPKNKDTHQTPNDSSIQNNIDEIDMNNKLKDTPDEKNSSTQDTVQLETKDTEQHINSDTDNNNSDLS